MEAKAKLPHGWTKALLEEVADVTISGVDKKSYPGQRDVFLCNYTDVYKNDHITNSIIFTKATAKENEVERFALKKGDVLITKDSETPNDIGIPAVVAEDLPNVLCGYHLALLRPKKNLIDSTYLAIALSHDNVKKYYACSANGMTRFGLTKSAIKKTHIILPSYNEQKRIGVVLSSWDKASEDTTKLLNANKRLKQALMQQLLTGKKRFKEFKKLTWEKMELHKFLTPIIRAISKPDTKYTALGIRSHGKGTFLRKVENHKDVMMDTLYEVREDDLIVNITFAWEGAIAIVKKTDEGAFVSHRFPMYVFDRTKVIPDFFRHVIVAKRFVYQLGLISPGGAGRNRVLSKNDFLTLCLFIPPLEEQKRIAGILGALDREINLLGMFLKTIQAQKSGLMQKLLTGRVRVKV